jgi:hypothetical protein
LTKTKQNIAGRESLAYISKYYGHVEEYIDFLNNDRPDIYSELELPTKDLKAKLKYSDVLVDLVHYFVDNVVGSND